MQLHRPEKLLPSKGNHQSPEETATEQEGYLSSSHLAEGQYPE
jgi:hypothetical protein